MIRVHGPYRHGDRWRLAFRKIGEKRLRYRSFESRGEAENVARSMLAELDAEALLDLPDPLPMPEDPVWVYQLHDEAGEIVYIGATRNLDGRYYDHRENHVPFATMTFFPEPFDRIAGLAVEAALIRKHSPPLNTAGSVETDRETDRYRPRSWKSPGDKT